MRLQEWDFEKGLLKKTECQTLSSNLGSCENKSGKNVNIFNTDQFISRVKYVCSLMH